MNDEATVVWDEYKYRHEHIWSTVYKLTYTVAFLGVIPYLDSRIALSLGIYIFLPGFLGAVLAVLGYLMIKRELCVFRSVKARHRELHFSKRAAIDGNPFFEKAVKMYLGSLCVASLLNFWVLREWLW